MGELMVDKPYIDEKLNMSIFVRKFNKDILEEELVWHRDKKNRVITVLEGINWEIQLDNELPKKMVVGDRILIPNNHFHRIKRGTTDLVLKIEEF